MTHNNKRYHGGLFHNEKQAAMSINLLCDKMGKERKNPMIDIKMIDIKHNAMQQVIYSLYFVHGKVKTYNSLKDRTTY